MASLSDIEFRVWVQYILSADDFGVLPASARLLQGHNRALDNRPTRKVQAALETAISVGLLLTFDHEGVRYLWSSKWQDYQGIRHPRRTNYPCPPDLTGASDATRHLFSIHTTKVPKDSGNISASRACAHPRGRETLTQPLTQTLTPTGESVRGETPPVWNPGGRTPQHSALVTRHHRCDPDAAEACGRGLCIPAFLVGQWRQQCGLESPALTTASIQDFIRATLERLPPGPIGDDPLHFWRAAWNAAHGSHAPAERKRSGGRESIAEQNLRGLREDLSRGH